MLYPIILYPNEDNTEYGVVVPDMPGVLSGGNTIADCLKNVQEAVEFFYEDEPPEALPKPSHLDCLRAAAKENGGDVLLTDIDTSFFSATTRG